MHHFDPQTDGSQRLAATPVVTEVAVWATALSGLDSDGLAGAVYGRGAIIRARSLERDRD